MKQKIYYLAFTLLGAVLGFFIHMVVEIWYIKMLLNNYQQYGLGLTWSQWETIHTWLTALLVLVLMYWGWKQGHKWWQWLYVDQKARKWLKKPLKTTF